MKTRNIAVLTPDEKLIGYLNDEYLTITETCEIGKLRQIKIEHPIWDNDTKESLDYYLSLLEHGNKIWWQKTPNGDSCLYVIVGERLIDPVLNKVTVIAEEAAIELSFLEPIQYENVVIDSFPGTTLNSRYVRLNSVGSVSIENDKLKLSVSTGTDARWDIRDFKACHVGIPISNTPNFTISVKIESDTQANNTWKGIGLTDGTAGKWCRVVRKVDSSGTKIKLETPRNDIAVDVSTQPVYFKLKLSAWQVTADYKTEDGDWQNIGSVYIDFDPTHVILFVSNQFSNYNGVVGRFDDLLFIPELGIPITVDSSWISSVTGGLFQAGTVESTTMYYGGVATPMALLRELENQTGKTVKFRYEYSVEEGIKRYIDIVSNPGVEHRKPIEIGYDTENITLEESEADSSIAIAPIHRTSSQEDIQKYHEVYNQWELLSVNPGDMIPGMVIIDQDNNVIEGPKLPAPFKKDAGSKYIYDTTGASGIEYHNIFNPSTGNNIMKVYPFDVNESHPYNIYWKLVEKLYEIRQPTVKFTTNVHNISLLSDTLDDTYYNVQDTVYLHINWREDKIPATVIKTEKSSIDPSKDRIELGNYQINFLSDYLSTFYPRSKRTPMEITYPTKPTLEYDYYSTAIKTPGNVLNMDTGGTWQPWVSGTTLAQAVASKDDGNGAYVSMGQGDTKTLAANTFGFNIPSNAEITNIAVTHRYKHGSITIDAYVTLLALVLGVPGVTYNIYYNDPKKLYSTYTERTEEGDILTFWKLADGIGPATVNSSGFGVFLRMRNNSTTTGNLFCDYIGVKVYYRIPRV